MRKSLKAATVFAVAAAIAPAARAQYTGVSHPDQVPVTTSPEGISQPLVYVPTPGVTPLVPPAPANGLKTRPADAQAVGDSGSTRTESSLPPTAPAFATEREEAAARRAGKRGEAAEAPGFDPDANVVTEVQGSPNQLPEGTLFKARIKEELSTTRTAVGQVFHAELTESVERDGQIRIPAGSTLTGKVTEVHGGRRIRGSASIHLQPLTVTLPDGTKYRIIAQVIDTSLYHSTKVDSEGTILRKDHAGRTLGVLGFAAASGAVAGALLAGGPGALVGATIGAGAGTIVWLKQDRQAVLPAETTITFALSQPLPIGIE